MYVYTCIYVYVFMYYIHSYVLQCSKFDNETDNSKQRKKKKEQAYRKERLS